MLRWGPPTSNSKIVLLPPTHINCCCFSTTLY
uniref:Uncharacterized protein n=1 Tax=Aegilops tauschii subsp. strangulata TaxID=200361 RepID=A0A453KVG2_AEGTS